MERSTKCILGICIATIGVYASLATYRAFSAHRQLRDISIQIATGNDEYFSNTEFRDFMVDLGAQDKDLQRIDQDAGKRYHTAGLSTALFQGGDNPIYIASTSDFENYIGKHPHNY